MSEIRELREYFSVFRKNIWVIIIVTLSVSVIAGVISYLFLTPLYEAKTYLLVNASKINDSSSLPIPETYQIVIKSPIVMEPVAKQLGGEIKIDQLMEKVSVESVKNTQVVSIVVRDSNATHAAMIANTIATVFKEEITKLMKFDNISVISPAQMNGPKNKVWPKPFLNISISFVLTLILSVGCVLLIEYFDTTLKTEQEIEKYLGLPVLGTVPVIKKNSIGNAEGKEVFLKPTTLNGGGNS